MFKIEFLWSQPIIREVVVIGEHVRNRSQRDIWGLTLPLFLIREKNMKGIEGRVMADLPAEKNDAEFDELRTRERLGIHICKLILGSNGDDLDLPRGEMLTKPVVFDSDGLGTRSHLRGVGSSKSKTSGVVFKDSRFDQRLGILFEREREP